MRELVFESFTVDYPRVRFVYRRRGETWVRWLDCGGLPEGVFRRADPRLLRALLGHVGLAFVPRLFTLEDFDRVIVRPLALSPAGAGFFQLFWRKGLAELRYRNGLAVGREIAIAVADEAPVFPVVDVPLREELLLLNGGGKDTAVAAELVKALGLPFTWIAVRETPAQRRVAAASGHPATLRLSYGGNGRRLRERCRYPGHTPFSSALAFLGVLTAALCGFRHVAAANERSANFGNLEVGGDDVNHQFAKSLEFETAFRGYVADGLVRGIEYFSILRPLWELQIAGLFSRLPAYFAGFVSCNQGIRRDLWCGRCPKCAFLFLALAPFLERGALAAIFRRDLAASERIAASLVQLVAGPAKPFECVGTREECRLALRLARRRHPQEEVFRRVAERAGLAGPSAAGTLPEDDLRRLDRPHHIPGDLWPGVRRALSQSLESVPFPEEIRP